MADRRRRHLGSKTRPPWLAKFRDCLSFAAAPIANNHMYDYGPDALLDPCELLLRTGIGVTGAGVDLDEARRPAIVERNGIRVGFLGYSQLFRKVARPPQAKSGKRRCASEPSTRVAVRV